MATNYESFAAEYATFAMECDFTFPPIEQMVSPSDFFQEDWEDADGEYTQESWVELASRVPGELEDNPALVFCTHSGRPGDITARTYRHI